MNEEEGRLWNEDDVTYIWSTI